MANIKKAIRQYLLNVSGVTDLVVARIYPGQLPQAVTLPAVVLEEISGNSEAHLGGLSGLAEARVRAKCYAATEAAAEALRDAVRVSGLVNYRGTTDSVYFCGATIGGKGAGADPPADGSDDWRWFLWIDFLVNFNEATS